LFFSVGQLSKFNQLAEQLHVDGVIVAGNFGFYGFFFLSFFLSPSFFFQKKNSYALIFLFLPI